MVEGVEVAAHDRHGESRVLFAPFHLAQYLQLDIEEFLELEPLPRLLQSGVVLGEVDIGECLGQPHQMVPLQHVHTDGIGHAVLAKSRHQLADNHADNLGIDARPLHRFGGVVVRFQPLCHLGLHLAPRSEFGMDEVVLVIEAGRFAEQQVAHAFFQLDILDTLEPNEFDTVVPVGESRAQPLGTARADGVPLRDFAYDLDVSILVIYLVNIVETAAVDVLVGEHTQHIESRFYPQFFTKNVGTLRADTLTIRYILDG